MTARTGESGKTLEDTRVARTDTGGPTPAMRLNGPSKIRTCDLVVISDAL